MSEVVELTAGARQPLDERPNLNVGDDGDPAAEERVRADLKIAAEQSGPSATEIRVEESRCCPLVDDEPIIRVRKQEELACLVGKLLRRGECSFHRSLHEPPSALVKLLVRRLNAQALVGLAKHEQMERSKHPHGGATPIQQADSVEGQHPTHGRLVGSTRREIEGGGGGHEFVRGGAQNRCGQELRKCADESTAQLLRAGCHGRSAQELAARVEPCSIGHAHRARKLGGRRRERDGRWDPSEQRARVVPHFGCDAIRAPMQLL
jgi:hypothetical protein